ncbi:MAG: hypothetical protein EZS28_013581 [Streblomastix strix]|uniref:Uncharacterized protein n=1 Tax=Streblomastix strix TaxID=222440 RepID=A0A5J4W8S2_9EUKA|nr:MAG: hypothetical protein EZS28_013581 [Streblomastix strix]
MKVSYVDIFIYLGEFEVCKVFYKTFDVENNAIGIKFIGKTQMDQIYREIHFLALGLEFTSSVEQRTEYGKLHEKPIYIEIKLHFLDRTVWDFALYTPTCNAHED